VEHNNSGSKIFIMTVSS